MPDRDVARDGLALAEIEADGRTATYVVSPDAQRPKYGIVTFADGAISAPVQIADLDYLAVTTLSAQRGRKRRLMDTLVESRDRNPALHLVQPIADKFDQSADHVAV